MSVMRCQTVSSSKGKSTGLLNEVPGEGTKIREIYDLFQANKGRVISFSFGRNQKILKNLIDFYGLDIRNIGQCKWVLAGEWFGKVYVDYITQRMNNDIS